MKKLFSILFFSCAFISLPLFSFAAASSSDATTAPVIVATVNFENVSMKSLGGNVFNISFDISNRVGAQPQVEYGVELSDGTSTVDRYIYPDTLTLGENTSLHENIQYTAPVSVAAGTYQMFLVSRNSNGLLFAIDNLGKVTITGNSRQPFGIITNSCYSTVNGAGSFVDNPFVMATDTLALNCMVENPFSVSLSAVPFFQTWEGSPFGGVVDGVATSGEALTIQPGEHVVNIPLPKATQPKNYSVAVTLSSAKPQLISNTLYFDYTILGMRGEIQNIVLDKTSYVAGDTASIQLYATFAVATGTVNIIVTDKAGNTCAAAKQQDISNGVSLISIPITQACNNPQAQIVLSAKNINGQIVTLDSQMYALTGSLTASSSVTSGGGSFLLWIILVLVVILVGGLLFWFIKKRRARASLMSIFVFVLAAVGLFSFGGNVAKADTASYHLSQGNPGGCCGFSVDFYYNVTYPPTVLQQDSQSITLSGSVSNGFTSDPDHPIYTAITSFVFNGVSPFVMTACYNSCSSGGSHTYTSAQPLVLGNHPITFSLSAAAQQGNTGVPYSGCGGFTFNGSTYEGCLHILGPVGESLNVAVVTPQSLITANPISVLSGATTTISFNSANVDICDITENGAPLYTATSSVSGWVNCSGEAGWCGFTGTYQVRYGAYGCWFAGFFAPPTCGYRYAYGTFTNGVSCGNNTFGDPAPGTSKSCDYYNPGYIVVNNPYLNGSFVTPPISTPTTFAMQCFRPLTRQVTSSSVTVGLLPALAASITATPQNIYVGSSTLISWTSTSSQSCIEYKNGVSWQISTSGSSVVTLTPPVLFSITCKDALNRTISTSTTVGIEILPPPPPPPVQPVPKVTICNALQGASTQVYVNKAMSWVITLPDPGVTGVSTQWNGDNINTTTNSTGVSLIYNTIGTKTIYATTTGLLSGLQYIATCSATTSVRLGSSTVTNS